MTMWPQTTSQHQKKMHPKNTTNEQTAWKILKQVFYATFPLSALIYFTLLSSQLTRFVNDREDNATINVKQSRYKHNFNSNVMCPPNIYSAKTRIENGTMKIAGPMGCVVSFLPDPIKALTSNPQDENENNRRWIITLGGSSHWGSSIHLLQLFLKETDAQIIKVISSPAPDVVELKIGRNGAPELRVWQNFENYKCFWEGSGDQNILIRVTVLHSRWMKISADRFERIVKKCGHQHRPKLDVVADVSGMWYHYCSHHTTWAECNLNQVNKTNSKSKYRSDANILLQTTNSIVARSLLFVDRSVGVEDVRAKERKAHFQHNDKGTHLTLQYDSYGHASNAFSVGDAMAFLHTMLGQTRHHQASNYVDQGCYDISFMNDVCIPKPQRAESWESYYLQYCAAEAVSCIEKSNYAELLVPSHEHSDSIHSTSPQFISIFTTGFSSRVRGGIVVLSVSLIATFVSIEGTKVPSSIPGIGTLRFIASLHIVAGHLQRFGRDYMTPVPFAEYGYTWVPWFMLLSAFILSWSAINKKPRRDCPMWYEFVLLRVQGIYPLYITGLIATAISSTRHISPRRYIIDLLLLHSWYPGWTEGAIMPHTWFLSAIIPCWMLHGFLFQRIKEVSTKKILLFCALVTFLPMFIFGIAQCWWCDHKTNQFNSIVDVLVIMSKFHPLCYLPIYASGICIAHLLHRWNVIQERVQIEQSHHVVNCLIHYGCSIGAAGTFMSFFLARINHFHCAKLVFRLGFLLPWHALLLMGLAVGSPQDPVRRLFEIQWLQIFGNVSYVQYIFQFTWFHKWYGRVDAGFWIFCVASSILVYYLIDRPCKTKKWIHAVGGIAITSFLIFAVGRYAHIDVGIDSKITLWAFDDAPTDRWINPSIVWANRTTLLVSARRLQLDTPASGIGSIWSSDIGIGELKLNTDKYGLALNANSAMRIIEQELLEVTSCHTPFMWIRGVEDPRLLMVNGSLYLTAVHHTQKNDVCVASPILVHSNEAWTNHRSQRIQTPQDDMTSTKNWVHLRDHHFMTNITTSTVVRMNPLGGEVEVLSYGEPSPWLRNMHGGSNLVESTSVIDGAKVWIGVIHSAETYRNHLVEFEYDKPYSPRRLSKILPLYAPSYYNVENVTNSTSTARGIAFASGLSPCQPGTSINDCLIITYGSNDREARSFVLEKEGMLELFHKGLFTSHGRYTMRV